MNIKWIVLVLVIAIAIVGIGLVAVYFGSYNNLVGLDESVDEKWAQVEQELQRRYDLIPRVVNASRIYIEYEGSILETITALRSQWATALQDGNVDEVNNVTTSLESAISNLIVVIEDYPELQASQVVVDLMVTLEGTENRISTERGRYNEAVRDYNSARRSFPANIWSGGWGFDDKDYFEAKVGAEDPPDVPV